jgi:hypothetical protein
MQVRPPDQEDVTCHMSQDLNIVPVQATTAYKEVWLREFLSPALEARRWLVVVREICRICVKLSHRLHVCIC